MDLYLYLEATEWWPWDDLNIHDINGCSVNNLSAADLQEVGEYLVDAELLDDFAAKVRNNNNKLPLIVLSKEASFTLRK